jgi:hypothetical protein
MKIKFFKGQKIPMLDETKPIVSIDTLANDKKIKHRSKKLNNKKI